MKLWMIILLLVLGGCEAHPKLISFMESSDTQALRAFQRACLEQPRRFIYLKEFRGREIHELKWRMQCMENADIERGQ